MADKKLQFPKGFLWGTATAAHQIEGGNTNNNWWLFEKRPGAIKNGDSSVKACDHWNRFEKDFDLIKKLNGNSYRMSIEWSRIYPSPGQVDKKALGHYHKMIDALLKRKITPFITLLHFTTPLWWEEKGGMLNGKEEHTGHFRDFCELIAREFRGQVTFWNTINEIEIVVLGYLTGTFPPGEKNFLKTFRAVDTLLKMHALAYHTVKNIMPQAQVGLVHNMQVVKPYNPSSLADRMLAGFTDYLFNGCYFRALKTGKLFMNFLSNYRGLRGSTDFMGLNFYNFDLVSPKLPDMALQATENPLCGAERLCAGLGWEPYPEGLLASMRRIQKELPGMPIYITENGIGTDDDQWRQKIMVDHLKMVHQAIREGIDVRGYFHWSLIDNFEWAEGYLSRFGLVHVDYKTQKRTIKESGKLYAEISRQNGIPPAVLKKFPEDIYRPDLGDR